jgi:hypothetical protein
MSWCPYILFDENRDYIRDKDTVAKDGINIYVFKYIHFEIIMIIKFAKLIKSYSVETPLECVFGLNWVCIRRCKFILDDYKFVLNIDDGSYFF